MEARYKKLMKVVKYYLLKEKRKKTRMGSVLSARVFDEHLWKWEEKGVATGAAWGSACAIAPVPMQTLFGIAACIWRRGNIPVAVLMAWLSFPGYQVFVWPVQWWVGAFVLSWFGVAGSGATLALAQECASKVPASFEAWDFRVALEPVKDVHFGMVVVELALGCAITCALFGGVFYWLVRIGWRVGLAVKLWFRRRRGL